MRKIFCGLLLTVSLVACALYDYKPPEWCSPYPETDSSPEKQSSEKKTSPYTPNYKYFNRRWDYEKVVKSWEGNNIYDLLNSWTEPMGICRKCPSPSCEGAPSNVTKVYIWHVTGVGTPLISNKEPDISCNTRFGVDEKGKIVLAEPDETSLLSLLFSGECNDLLRSGQWSPALPPDWHEKDK